MVLRIKNSVVYWGLFLGMLFLGGPSKSRADPCQKDEYAVGFGKVMMMTPLLPIGMMGYAHLPQKVAGVHMPLMSRTMVVERTCEKAMVGLVIAEMGMVFHHLKSSVLERLQEKAPGIFNESNLMVSATHTHAGIGGYAERFLYNITVGGHFKAVESAIVSAIVDSVWQAYQTRKTAHLTITTQESKTDLQFNRSLGSYENNPGWERAMYGSSVDPEMVMLTARDPQGNAFGSFNWFGVHPVSLSMENTLISGDNKGMAAYLLEQHMNEQQGVNPGSPSQGFIAGFVQSKAGDVSPYSIESGAMPQDFGWSRNQDHGRQQYELALEALRLQGEKIRGPIIGQTQRVYLSKTAFTSRSHEKEETFTLCRGGLGVAFAAGTENGKPVPLFKEGTIYGVNWPRVTLIPQEQRCQGQKVMLLPTGFLGARSWTANEAPFQLIRLGQLLIAGLPFEITIMAGRRLERRLQSDLEPFGITKVVLTSLANEYLHYVTTREEYETQSYEGGSNLFGPRSLEAYEDIYHGLAQKIAFELDQGFSKSLSPQTFKVHATREKLGDFSLPIRAQLMGRQRPDRPMKGFRFGDIVSPPEPSITVGGWQRVSWVGARWENQDPSEMGDIIAVERFDGKEWQLYANVESPETTVAVDSQGPQMSRVTMSWQPRATGDFRMCYRGRALLAGQQYQYFRSCSLGFKVVTHH